jgi:hypothetical protein
MHSDVTTHVLVHVCAVPRCACVAT